MPYFMPPRWGAGLTPGQSLMQGAQLGGSVGSGAGGYDSFEQSLALGGALGRQFFGSAGYPPPAQLPPPGPPMPPAGPPPPDAVMSDRRAKRLIWGGGRSR